MFSKNIIIFNIIIFALPSRTSTSNPTNLEDLTHPNPLAKKYENLIESLLIQSKRLIDQENKIHTNTLTENEQFLLEIQVSFITQFSEHNISYCFFQQFEEEINSLKTLLNDTIINDIDQSFVEQLTTVSSSLFSFF